MAKNRIIANRGRKYLVRENRIAALGARFLGAVALVLLLVLSTASLAAAQRNNTFYVDQFAGVTVAQKATAAQLECNANTAIPCVIVFDTILAGFATGTLPAKCSQCTWIDYRTANVNPTNGSGQLLIGDGTAALPGAAFAGAPSTGWSRVTGFPTFTFGGAKIWAYASTAFTLNGGVVFGFSTGAPIDTSPDTTIARASAGVVNFGTGSTSNALGTVALAKLRLATEDVSAAPRMTWSCFITSGLAATSTFCEFTTIKAITIEQVSVRALTAPATCTTNAIVQVTDGTNAEQLTITAAANLSNGLTRAIPAAATLQMKVLTAAATCGTFPANANMTVVYRMQ